MNQDPNKRTVRIVNAKTGEVRLSEPVPVHPSRQGSDEAGDGLPPLTTDLATCSVDPLLAEPPAADSQGNEVHGAAPLSKHRESSEQNLEARQVETTESLAVTNLASEPNSEPKISGEATNGNSAGKKAKTEPETLEQFIEYAYARKGRRLTLSPKTERQIVQAARLDDAAISRLLHLAKADTLLAVPRQILLVSQEVTGLPGLRAALTSFVTTVMMRHPVFGDAGVKGALRNLPDGGTPAEVVANVAAYERAADAEAETLKSADLHELRNNAVSLFVTWLAVTRGRNLDELSSLLFQVVWQPAAKHLADDNARLRALTEIEQTAGVGLACQRFHQQAIDARTQQDQVQREATSLRERLSDSEDQLSDTAAQLESVRAELQVLRESSAAALETLRRQHADERTHLQHELEQLRGRMVKRLTDSVDMLEVGLSALRKDNPRVPVMLERAEHVVDALRAEVQELREE